MTDLNSETDDIQSYSAIPMRGINISGAEAGSNVSYGLLGMPDLQTDMSYYIENGMNTVRFPIKWSYITDSADATSPSASGQEYLDAVTSSINEMLDAGLYVILDLHSYMRFSPDGYAGSGSHIATSDEMYNIWSVISENLKDVATAHPDTLVLEISNEPNSMSTMQVLENNNAGIEAIRDAGLTNLISIQGNSWSGLHSWLYPNPDGLSNAEVFIPANINDPLNNYAIAVHQYVDWNGSGTSPQGQNLNDFVNYANIDEFMQWVNQNDVKVLLDEFGSGNDANGFADINYLLSQVEANAYVEGEGGFIGWAAWVGGHTWAQNNFNYIGPNADGTDNAHMSEVYLQHLAPLDGEITLPPSDGETDTPPIDAGDSNPDNSGNDNDSSGTTTNPPSSNPITNSHSINWDWGARELISNFNPDTDAIDLTEFWTNYNNITVSEDGAGNIDINLLSIDNHMVKIEGVSFADFGEDNIKGVTGDFQSAAIDSPTQYYTYGWNYGAAHTIDDFNPETGVIELVAFGRGFNEYEIYNDADGNAVIDIGFNSQKITLSNVDVNDLSADNFLGVSGSYDDALGTAPPVMEDPVNTTLPPADEDAGQEDPIDTSPPPGGDPVVDEPPTDTGGDGATTGKVINVGWNWGAEEVYADFNVQTDAIDLSAFWTNYDKFTIHEDGEGNLVLNLLDLNNHTVTLENTSLDEFSGENIIGVSGNYNDAVQTDPMKIYSFNWNYGQENVVDDFDPETGVIDLTAFQRGYHDVDIGNDVDGNAVIDLSFDNQTITLNGVDANQIDQDNFL